MTNPWKLVLLLVGIFVAGSITGAFVTLRFGRDWVARRPGPEQWAPNHMKRLMERLDLKPEQVEQIRPIVHRNMEELNRVRNDTMAETKGVFERMEREIAERLTPEQRIKFDQLNKEMRERAKRFTPDRQTGAGGPRPDRDPPEKPPGDQPPPAKPPGT